VFCGMVGTVGGFPLLSQGERVPFVLSPGVALPLCILSVCLALPVYFCCMGSFDVVSFGRPSAGLSLLCWFPVSLLYGFPCLYLRVLPLFSFSLTAARVTPKACTVEPIGSRFSLSCAAGHVRFMRCCLVALCLACFFHVLGLVLWVM